VILENIEFLIATNNYLSLKSDIIISKNEIIESGGLMMVSLSGSVPNFNPSEMSSVIIEITGIDSQQFLISPKGYGFYLQNFEISDKIGIYNISANYDGQIIDSFEISVIPADISYVKTHTKSWIDGSMSDYSYLQKASLVLNDNYDIPLDVQSPEWFVESAQRWLNDSVNDDSFYDMILFLAKNDFK
jgi:hypothetical protein